MNKIWKFRMWEVVLAIFLITCVSYCSGYYRSKADWAPTAFNIDDVWDQPACLPGLVSWYDLEHQETNIVFVRPPLVVGGSIMLYGTPDPLYSNANITERAE